MKRREFISATAAATGTWAAGRMGLGRVAVPIQLTPVPDPAALRERLVAQARQVFARNRVASSLGVFHLPSDSNYRRFYAWDSGWNIISQSAFDPESALLELEAVFNLQDETGHVAHEALIPEWKRESDPTYQSLGRGYFDEHGRSYLIDPPSFVAAGAVLYRRAREERIFKLLPKMEKCLDYLLGPRDLFGNGLSAIIHPWESGTDLAPADDAPLGLNYLDPLAGLKAGKFFGSLVNQLVEMKWDLEKIRAANLFVLEDPGLNALTAAGALAVSELYQAAGDAARAGHWRGRAQKLVAAMEEHLWDEERGFFFPRWNLQRPQLSKRTSLTGLVPLMTGLVSPDKAKRMIEGYLLDPKQFWAPWLTPFNSLTEMAKEPPSLLHLHLWRGACIWINMNWMAARSAKAYGYLDAAREITRKTALMIDRQGFREFYRPHTGRGVGAENFTWPALVLELIEEFGIG